MISISTIEFLELTFSDRLRIKYIMPILYFYCDSPDIFTEISVFDFILPSSKPLKSLNYVKSPFSAGLIFTL